MYESGSIAKHEVTRDGTWLVVLVSDKNLLDEFQLKQFKKCGLWLEDGRHITDKQRKMIYATIRDISVHTGYQPEEQKEWLKYLHIERTGCQYFSLSSCSIDTGRDFINTILEYAIQEGVHLSAYLLDRTEEIGKAMYFCLKHKKCSICGRDGEIHHIDTIGMGNDRKKYDDSDSRKICLCRIHHTEAHKIGAYSFEKKYRVYGIKYE